MSSNQHKNCKELDVVIILSRLDTYNNDVVISSKHKVLKLKKNNYDIL